MMRERLIFHIDVNSAFLSWESIYRMEFLEEEVDLRTIPSAVGGNREKRHGIILAKSTPAKKYGIQTAETIVSALNKCPNLVLVPARFDWYERCSKAFIDILQEYSPDIEQCSIDEAYIDMTDTCHLFGTPMETAHKIREHIYKKLGFTVNVGISFNKLLAKMASDFEKPNLCHSLFLDEIQEKMWSLPVGELFFVGKSAKEKLDLLGIKTIGDLAQYDKRILESHLGQKYASLIHGYANGIAEDHLETEDGFNKGYGNSTTLSYDVENYDVACQVLLALSETVGTRLRADNIKCNCITVELKNNDFIRQSHQVTLKKATDSTGVIYEYACNLLKEVWDDRPLRLIGLRTTKLEQNGYEQISFLEDKKNKKLERLDVAVDSIRSKYGMDAIKRASFLDNHAICNHALDKKNRHE